MNSLLEHSFLCDVFEVLLKLKLSSSWSLSEGFISKICHSFGAHTSYAFPMRPSQSWVSCRTPAPNVNETHGIVPSLCLLQVGDSRIWSLVFLLKSCSSTKISIKAFFLLFLTPRNFHFSHLPLELLFTESQVRNVTIQPISTSRAGVEPYVFSHPEAVF